MICELASLAESLPVIEQLRNVPFQISHFPFPDFKSSLSLHGPRSGACNYLNQNGSRLISALTSFLATKRVAFHTLIQTCPPTLP
jgi:hypothetical protein